jgi:hypothetical protein
VIETPPVERDAKEPHPKPMWRGTSTCHDLFGCLSETIEVSDFGLPDCGFENQKGDCFAGPSYPGDWMCHFLGICPDTPPGGGGGGGGGNGRPPAPSPPPLAGTGPGEGATLQCECDCEVRCIGSSVTVLLGPHGPFIVAAGGVELDVIMVPICHREATAACAGRPFGLAKPTCKCRELVPPAMGPYR